MLPHLSTFFERGNIIIGEAATSIIDNIQGLLFGRSVNHASLHPQMLDAGIRSREGGAVHLRQSIIQAITNAQNVTIFDDGITIRRGRLVPRLTGEFQRGCIEVVIRGRYDPAV